MNYQVNEIHRTIQGEGWHAGLPCTLVRLQGCNLRCLFCDTPQALDSEGGTSHTPEELLEAVKVVHHKGDIVLITGGEPTLQDLSHVIWRLDKDCGPVHMETNGTGRIAWEALSWVTVSPKVAKVEGTWTPVRSWLDEYPRVLDASEIKILVEHWRDADVWAQPLKDLKFGGKVSVQPISQGHIATRAALDACLKYGWRLSLQIHKYMGVP